MWKGILLAIKHVHGIPDQFAALGMEGGALAADGNV
jgi:hypothetical protein